MVSVGSDLRLRDSLNDRKPAQLTTWIRFLVPTNLKAPKRSYISSLGVVLNSLVRTLAHLHDTLETGAS